MLLGFTCKICDTRTHRTLSKQAYTKGVVLIECPSCKNRHLVADNLGWFGQRGKALNIEEILAEKGEAAKKSCTHDEIKEILELV